MSFNVAVVTIARNDYEIHSWFMLKCETVNRMKNTDLNYKNWTPLIMKKNY